MDFKFLKNKDFFLFIFGKFVSMIGSYFQSFALSVYVLKITGSGTKFASVLAIAIILQFILGAIVARIVSKKLDLEEIFFYTIVLFGIVLLGSSLFITPIYLSLFSTNLVPFATLILMQIPLNDSSSNSKYILKYYDSISWR